MANNPGSSESLKMKKRKKKEKYLNIVDSDDAKGKGRISLGLDPDDLTEEDLMFGVPRDLISSCKNNSILNAESMVDRMQKAIIQDHAVKVKEGKVQLNYNPQLKEKHAKDMIDYEDKEMNMYLSKEDYTVPLLLNVPQFFEKFKSGTLSLPKYEEEEEVPVPAQPSPGSRRKRPSNQDNTALTAAANNLKKQRLLNLDAAKYQIITLNKEAAVKNTQRQNDSIKKNTSLRPPPPLVAANARVPVSIVGQTALIHLNGSSNQRRVMLAVRKSRSQVGKSPSPSKQSVSVNPTPTRVAEIPKPRGGSPAKQFNISDVLGGANFKLPPNIIISPAQPDEPPSQPAIRIRDISSLGPLPPPRMSSKPQSPVSQVKVGNQNIMYRVISANGISSGRTGTGLSPLAMQQPTPFVRQTQTEIEQEVVPQITSVVSHAPSATAKPSTKNNIDDRLGVFLRCDLCNDHFPSHEDCKFKIHNMVHHGRVLSSEQILECKVRSRLWYKCRRCSELLYDRDSKHKERCFPNNTVVEPFVEMREGDRKGNRVQCFICRYLFETNIEFRDHMKTTHPEVSKKILFDPKLRCASCLKPFLGALELMRHAIDCHMRYPTLETTGDLAVELLFCEVCSSAHNTIEEAQSCLLRKKIIRCILCKFMVFDRTDFFQHMSDCHGRVQEGIPCPFCDRPSAMVRKTFEHVVTDHYDAALNQHSRRSYEKTLKTLAASNAKITTLQIVDNKIVSPPTAATTSLKPRLIAPKVAASTASALYQQQKQISNVVTVSPSPQTPTVSTNNIVPLNSYNLIQNASGGLSLRPRVLPAPNNTTTVRAVAPFTVNANATLPTLPPGFKFIVQAPGKGPRIMNASSPRLIPVSTGTPIVLQQRATTIPVQVPLPSSGGTPPQTHTINFPVNIVFNNSGMTTVTPSGVRINVPPPTTSVVPTSVSALSLEKDGIDIVASIAGPGPTRCSEDNVAESDTIVGI